MPSADMISFARGAPSLDIVDVDGLKAAAAKAFESDPAGTTAYGTAIGYPPLREWIAEQQAARTVARVREHRPVIADGGVRSRRVDDVRDCPVIALRSPR
jgi:DNA-binding transcriptional MocR family regulator